jgi:hypothetical protein
MIFDFLKKKKYNTVFVYKWGILAGVVETLLILFSAFVLINLGTLFEGNLEAISIFSTFYLIVAIIFTFFIVFGMPLYLAFKKKMISTALLVLLMTIATLSIIFTALLLMVTI